MVVFKMSAIESKCYYKYLIFWTTGILEMEVNCIAEGLSCSTADLPQLTLFPEIWLKLLNIFGT